METFIQWMLFYSYVKTSWYCEWRCASTLTHLFMRSLNRSYLPSNQLLKAVVWENFDSSILLSYLYNNLMCWSRKKKQRKKIFITEELLYTIYVLSLQSRTDFRRLLRGFQMVKHGILSKMQVLSFLKS